MVRPPPPLLALSAALLKRAMTRDAPPPTSARAAAAGATAVASVALAGAADVAFQRRGTTVKPFDPGQASVLVTSGANAISRNPMYVGMTGLLLANAIRRGSWAALLPAAGFAVVIDRWQIAAEEAALLAKFGADYEAYRARVPRWLGGTSAASPSSG